MVRACVYGKGCLAEAGRGEETKIEMYTFSPNLEWVNLGKFAGGTIQERAVAIHVKKVERSSPVVPDGLKNFKHAFGVGSITRNHLLYFNQS